MVAGTRWAVALPLAEDQQVVTVSGEGGGEFLVYLWRLHDPAVRYAVPIRQRPVPVVKEEVQIALGALGPEPALP